MSEEIQYYYDRSQIDDSVYADREQLEYVLSPKIEEIRKKLSSKYSKLKAVWTAKNTLGYVLINFETEKKAISKGASALLKGIQTEYQFTVLSKSIKGKYKKIVEGDVYGIEINIDYFNYIFQKIGDQKKIIELFLKDPKPEEIEENVLKELFIDHPEKVKELMDVEVASSFFRQHAITKPDEIKTIMELLIELSQKYEVKETEGLRKILDITIHLLDIYKIQNPDEFKKVAFFFVDVFEKHNLSDVVGFEKAISIATKLLENQKITNENDMQKLIDAADAFSRTIVEGHVYFEGILDQFEDMIKSDEEEEKVRDFIFKHIWIVDFKYFGYKKTTEEKTNVGDIDLAVYQNQLGINRVILMEFKRPDEPFTTIKDHGEDKPVILSKVGRAISQTIHYIEEKKKTNQFVDGIIIIGRKREHKDLFIEKFNDYLHGLKVVTFDDLLFNARRVVQTFKMAPDEIKNTT